MKKILFALLMLTMSINVFAEQAAKPASVEKLMKLMDIEKMTDAIYAQINGVFKNIAKQNGATEADKLIQEKYMDQLSQVMKEEISWAKFKEPMIKIYTQNFTEQEVLAFIRFYETKEGRSMLKKLPLIMQDSMKVSQEMMKTAMPKIQAIAKNMDAELKAQHQAAQNKPQEKPEAKTETKVETTPAVKK